MIKSSKIQEWINEIEERPMIAPFIVRRLSERLVELDEFNEELRSENLLLRSGKKIEDYEQKITELEYQIELLKRQFQNSNSATPSYLAHLLVYDASGRILSRELRAEELFTDSQFATISNLEATHSDDIHLLAVDSMDELLFLFDSGRIATQKANEIPCTNEFTLDWHETSNIDMRSGERLVTVITITHLPLSDQCIQLSRKGFAKSFQRDLFQGFLSSRNLGKGVKSQADQLFNLTLCNQDEIFAWVSQSGYISAMPASVFSIMLKEIIRLDIKDYLVSAFTVRPDQNLVIATQEGEIYPQRNPWQDIEDADGGKRRLILSRTKAGKVSVIGASAAANGCWGFMLMASGDLNAYKITMPDGKTQTKPRSTMKKGHPALAFTTWEPHNQGETAAKG